MRAISPGEQCGSELRQLIKNEFCEGQQAQNYHCRKRADESQWPRKFDPTQVPAHATAAGGVASATRRRVQLEMRIRAHFVIAQPVVKLTPRNRYIDLKSSDRKEHSCESNRLVTNENFALSCRDELTKSKKKRADLCLNHKADPRSSTFRRKDRTIDKAW